MKVADHQRMTVRSFETIDPAFHCTVTHFSVEERDDGALVVARKFISAKTGKVHSDIHVIGPRGGVMAPRQEA